MCSRDICGNLSYSIINFFHSKLSYSKLITNQCLSNIKQKYETS